MSSFRRRLMMAAFAGGGGGGDGVELPTIFQRVEYIQATGNAYLELGVKNKSTFGVKYKIGGQFWCGAANGGGQGVGGGWMGGADVQFTAAYDWNPIGFTPQTPFVLSSNYMGSGDCYVDDTYIRPFTNGGNSDFNFSLFCQTMYDGATRYYLGGPLYHFELTDGNTLVMDLWPCYRKSDHTPGMFDLVTRKFFTNANSTGSFLLGADIPSHTPYLVFVDPAVEAICVANWGDGVGITPTQAAAVTNSQFGETFKENTQITSFYELEYFTGLTEIPGSAFRNSSITGVTIPENVTSCAVFSFANAASLATVILRPTTPPTYAYYTLGGNSSGLKIYVPYSADHSILTAYQTASGWSSWANIIYELNPDGTIPS